MKLFRFFGGVLGLLLLAAFAPLYAQTVTGTLAGRVLDPEGKPVAGALVTVAGSAVQGTRTVPSDTEGRYTIPHLAPAEDYTVKVEAPGFASASVERRAIHPETITVQDFRLGPGAQDVVVTAPSPTLSLRQAIQPLRLPEKEVRALPVLGEFSDRSYQSLLYWSPAATQSRVAGNPAVSGATAIENVYQIDGLTTNDPVTGAWGTNLNVAFLKQIQGETSSFEAADASSTGGLFTLVTRSGADTFHGDLFAWGTTSGMTSDRKADSWGKTEVNDFSSLDWGATFSGPLVKERLWFFAGLNPYHKVEHRRGTTTVQSTTGGASLDLPASWDSPTDTLGFLGKLSWRVTPSHLLEFSFFGDPSDQELNEGVPATLFEESRASRREVGGTDAVLRWYATFRPDLFLDAHAGVTRRHNDLTPDGGSASWASRSVVSLDWNQSLSVSPGYGRFSYDERDTDQAGFKLVWTPSGKSLSHELALGAQLERASWEQTSDYTGGAYVEVKTQFGPDVTDPADYRYNYIYTIGNPHLEESGSYSALFFQDRMTFADRFTATLGLRWERNHLDSQMGNDLSLDSLSPRLAFAWDFLGNGRAKLFASAGRYYERVPLYLAQSLDAAHPTTKDTYNYGVLTSHTVYSTNPAIPLPGVKNQSQDEYTLGVQWEVAPEFVLTGRLLYRDLNRLLETVGYVNAAGGIDYLVMNPGDQTTPLLDTWAGRVPGYTSFPKPRRTFKAFELMAEKRFSDRWFLQANYTLSRLEGNTAAGMDSTWTDVLPNATTEWDIPSAVWVANRYGLLPTDRTHQFKAMAAYQFDHGFLVSATLRADSGRPINKLADWPKNEFGYGKLYVTPRGSEGRTPFTTSLSLHGEWAHRLGPGDITLFVDVVNLFNTQDPFRLDETYYNKRNTWGSATVVSSTWGWTKKYTDPRAIGIGARWSF